MLSLKTEEALVVAPKSGKAVLFYSQLPDGNMDDLSLHAALPVTKGEKWLVRYRPFPFATVHWAPDGSLTRQFPCHVSLETVDCR
jgi:hypothetical protein